MGKKSQSSLSQAESVAQQAMPGWEVISEPKLGNDFRLDSLPEYDASMPSIKDLKRKYGVEPLKDSVPQSEETRSGKQSDKQTMNVRLKSGPLEKTIGVSKGKILWNQG